MRGDVGWASTVETHFQPEKLYNAVESRRQSHSYLLGNIISRLYSLVTFETMGILKNYFLLASPATSK